MVERYAQLGAELRELVHDTDKFARLRPGLNRLTWLEHAAEPVCKPQLIWRMLDSAVLCTGDGADPELLDPICKQPIDGTFVNDVNAFLDRYVAWVHRATRLLLENKRFILYIQPDAIRRDKQRAISQLRRLQKKFE